MFPIAKTELEAHVHKVLEQLAEVVHTKSAEVEIDRPLPAVSANPTLLDQVLRNLLDNALKFVRPGLKPRIHIWAQQKQHTVQITMEDNCIEIEPENQERIFRVFERLTRRVPLGKLREPGLAWRLSAKPWNV